MIRLWRIDTPSQTLVLQSRDGRLPSAVYWSAPLPPGEDLETLADTLTPPASSGTLSVIPEIGVCPLDRDGFTGFQGMEIRGPDGAVLSPALRLSSDRQDHRSLRMEFDDGVDGVSYCLEAQAFPDTNVIRLSATARLTREAEGRILWLSAPVLQAGPDVEEVVEFSGRWCGEFRSHRSRLVPGIRSRENRLGRSSHEHYPGLLFPARGATENSGEAFGLTLGHPGGHRHVVETLPTGRTQVQIGPAPGICPAASAVAGPLYVTRSGSGLNGVSQSFHEHVRRQVLQWPDPARPRPVHYNCWEAVYFDQNLETLSELARQAADLGAERFVLDDGWFGRRDDDRTSLGDWSVDERKWPEGLAPLIDRVNGLGMGFGLWFEPEMISAESALARRRPEWILGPPDQPEGRNQLCLNLAVREAADEVFRQMDALLSNYAIEYVKWDHNRVLPFPDPRQAAAACALLARLRAAHPGVEIESCAAGGGRADLGILEHTHRIWLSDSNDAHERLRIQRGASYFLPPEICGSHVGPRTCHTSGRTYPMRFRAAVAATRSMGLELDLREMTSVERSELRLAIETFKRRRALLATGRLYRLECSDPNRLSEMHVARDGSTFVLFSGTLATSPFTVPQPVRLAGLEADAEYRVVLENADAVPPGLNRGRRSRFLRGQPVRATGAALTNAGLQMPNSHPDTLWTVMGIRH